MSEKEGVLVKRNCEMLKYKVADVFVQTGYPEHTYAVRKSLDMNFKTSLMDKGSHIYLWGKSKSGKSSMWRKNMEGQCSISIPITGALDIEGLYNNILNELEAFYISEIENGDTHSAKLKGGFEAKIIAALKANVEGEEASEDSTKTHEKRVAEPKVDLHTVMNYMKHSDIKLILEEFQCASENFVRELMDCLKAFADNDIKVILVGITDRTYEMFQMRMDLSGRVTVIDVDTFKNDELQQILNLGQEKLNCRFSKEVSAFLISEADKKAYVLQNLCRNLCMIEGIEETAGDTHIFDSMENAIAACKLLADRYNSQYSNTVKVLSSAGTKANQSDSYRTVLRALKNVRVGNDGIAIKDIIGVIREQGCDIKDGSVNASVPRLKKILENNNKVIQVFDYQDKRLYITDDIFQFYLRWSEEIQECLLDNVKE